MDLLAQYMSARREEELARLKRTVALRAMRASGMSQREIAATLGVSQPAVSQQFSAAAHIGEVEPDLLLEAAGPVLKEVSQSHGYRRLAVFGSVARGEGRPDSDIDLLVEPPEGTSSFDFVRFTSLLEETLGRKIDLVSYGGLKPGIDDDILSDAVLL